MNKKAVILGAALAATVAATKPPRQQGKTAAMEPPAEDTGIPPRLSIERSSPYYTSCGNYVGVRLNGEDVNGRVVEYSVALGWVRLVAPELSGKPLSAYDASRAEKHFGTVETYWRVTPSRQVRRQLARIA